MTGADVDPPATEPGRSASLLRMAGLAIPVWLRGGSTELFERIRAWGEEAAVLRELGREIATRIGAQLVPDPAVGGAERALLLRVRRSLHNGSSPRPDQVAAAAAAARRQRPGSGLGADIEHVFDRGRRLALAWEQLAADAEREEIHKLGEAWQLLHEHEAWTGILAGIDPAIHADVVARLAAGEPWTTKRMRTRGDYLWRMVTRAATRATPRRWFAHVAQLDLDGGQWTGTDPLPVRADAAAVLVDNVNDRPTGADAAALLRSDDTVRVAIAPLARLTQTHLAMWTHDGKDAAEIGERRLRRNPALDAVVGALAQQARPLAALLHVVAGPGPERRRAMTDLIAHLVERGALALQRPADGGPRIHVTGWVPLETTVKVVAAAEPASDAFVDVYRRVGAGVAPEYSQRLGQLVGLALRVGALMDADEAAAVPALPAPLTDRPRPLLSVVGECLTAGVEVVPPRTHHWRPAVRADSGYAALLASVEERLDAGRIDLDESFLDRLGSPRPVVGWPLDCLIRPLLDPDGPAAVLDDIIPAGLLDARFIPAMTELVGTLPQVEAYRSFLTRTGSSAGVSFVEVLAPPLTHRAANAVRRPSYTPLWTGDPDWVAYLPGGGAGFVPLSRITVRVEAGQVVAETDGARIWPVFHSARRLMPPWNIAVALLRLASPQPRRDQIRSLTNSLPAWPGRSSVPRITVGGSLVISPARWRIQRSEFWHPADRLVAKLSAIDGLRRRHGMPRLVQVNCDTIDDEPWAADLLSLHALRTVEHCLRHGATALTFQELLAEPHLLPVVDRAAADAGPSVAEILLRLDPRTPTAEPTVSRQ